MKKVIGIIMVLVMVVMVNVAIGDSIDEIMDFCNENHRLMGDYIVDDENAYKIVNNIAYTIGNLAEAKGYDMWEFMDWYESYLEENWPEMAEQVRIDYTYVTSTDNYDVICVWLDLNHSGKTFKDYNDFEPETTLMSALIGCVKK